MITITSWNRCSFRFLRAPVVEWRPVRGEVAYRVVARSRLNERVLRATVREPRFDFGRWWKELPVGFVQWAVTAHDRRGRELDMSHLLSFCKAEDRFVPPTKRADWLGAVERNMHWLMTVRGPKLPLPKGEKPPRWGVDRNHDPKLPVWVWHADMMDHKFLKCANFPPLQWPMLIRLFFEYAETGKDARYRKLCLAYAPMLGRLLRKFSWPASYRLGGMPATMIGLGKLGHPPPSARSYSTAYTLPSASRTGSALLLLFAKTGQKEFLDHALHIATKTLGFQRADGGFPARVHCRTGKVLCEFATATIAIVNFFEELAAHRLVERSQRIRFATSCNRAVDWLLRNPVATNRWDALFEDMEIMEPYTNMSCFDALDVVRYLARHADEDRSFLPTAERIHDWVEDQFVVFGRDDSLKVNPPLPSMYEQYHCPYPMEAHTANWLDTLLALQKATGKEIYRQKALAAANAIVEFQGADGRFYTFGPDRYLKQSPVRSEWFACNAFANWMLLRFANGR